MSREENPGPPSGSFSVKRFGALFLCTTALFGGCTSFDHLTHIPTAGEAGPTAQACGSCHGQQHLEWQRSVHAQAATGSAPRARAWVAQWVWRRDNGGRTNTQGIHHEG